MKIITLFLILVLSISVYAKTEARIELGFESKQKRNLAAAGAAVDAVNIISAFANMNSQNSNGRVKGRVPDSPSFTNKDGALTPSSKTKVKKTSIIIK
jgi:hypothetical protein